MPELPEVETVRRGVEPVMLHQVFVRVDVRRGDLRFPVPENFSAVLTGKCVKSVERRGKYLLVFCEGGDGFVWHLGMSGSVRIYGLGELYEPAKHDHVVFEVSTGARVVFNDPRRFGFLDLLRREDWVYRKPFHAMGPEPLDDVFCGDVLRERLEGKKSPIKAALLDQRVVAGLGNIYVCEALYRAGISPLRPAGKVSAAEVANLVGHIKDVLGEAIASGGSSLRDHKLTDGSLGYFQHHFDVYDREGEICRLCKKGGRARPCVERIVQAGRSSFFCSKQQK